MALALAPGTDDVDVIDPGAVSPSLVRAVSRDGERLVGNEADARRLREALLKGVDVDDRSPAEQGGLFEDADGDSEFDIFDVQALFNGLDSDAVQNHPEAFNFNEDENPEDVTILDVQELFNRLADWEA